MNPFIWCEIPVNNFERTKQFQETVLNLKITEMFHPNGKDNNKNYSIMASNSETGHTKNAANFADLISFCTGYGATYSPTKAAIKLTALYTSIPSSWLSQHTL